MNKVHVYVTVTVYIKTNKSKSTNQYKAYIQHEKKLI